ncbi:YfcE family phosphodiesterase [Ulvibacterium sp.]|uniref:YfcE family phosphodiesterase n=1 Tax=Ulvibacterium sp. TaxID=2665914 RepID=UPI002610762B|nr:YfcE family phosphodiesterase [Ulvibacterium sp.]
MKIAILSDIHDHTDNLQKALAEPELQTTETLLCCGDLCSPFIIKLLGRAYSQPIHIVLGNNDGDVASLIGVSKEYPNITIHGEYFRGELGGKSFAMNHYPEKARILAEHGAFDVVCYGHNHNLVAHETLNDTLFINPGTLMGFHGGNLKTIPATFLILDSKTLETKVYRI